MSDRRPPQSDDEILEAFAELFDSVPPDTPEEIQAALLEAGIDPDQVANEVKQLVEDGLASSPYNWRNAQPALDQARLELEASQIETPGERSDIVEAIQQLLSQSRDQSLAAHFRNENFSQMSKEELASLYQELKYLSEHNR